MSGWRQRVETGLICAAFTFLLNILLGVPLVLVVYLLGIKDSGVEIITEIHSGPDSGLTDTAGLPFLQALAEFDDDFNNVSSLDGILSRSIDNLVTNSPFVEVADSFDLNESNTNVAFNNNVTFASEMWGIPESCPTCMIIGAAKYFNQTELECPKMLMNRLCCFCGKPPEPEPFVPQITFDECKI